MLPHGRKDVKFDSKSKMYQLNELAELYNCNNVMFFEARKGKDLYMWFSKVPNGPTVKMHAQNCRSQSGWYSRFGGLTAGSAHNGGASFHRKLPQGHQASALV
jgi:hypothetical protein